MKIMSTNTGKPEEIEFQSVKKMTSMKRVPQSGGIRIEFTGVDGDLFDAPQFHGGEDNRVYALGLETHREFAKLLGRNKPFEEGAFGENLTVESLDESQIFMGDIFRVGDAEIQATFPRIPCSKLNFRFQNSEALAKFRSLKRPGVYFRVLKAGHTRPGDQLLAIQSSKTPRVSLLALYLWLTSQEKLSERRLKEISTMPYAPAIVRNKLASLASE